MQQPHALLKMRSVTDEMAVIRTWLANERTFLAYLRTFIAAFAAGVGFIKFTGDLFFVRTGFVLAAISPAVLIMGLCCFVRTQRAISHAILESGDPARRA